MALNPNELLIFKKRGIKVEAKKKAAKLAAAKAPVPKENVAATPAQTPAPTSAPTPTPKSTLPKFEAKPEEKPNVAPLIKAKPAEKENDTDVYISKMIKEEEENTKKLDEIQKIEDELEPGAPRIPSGQITKKESLKLAKGRTCTTHPWRDAYAICSYCKRPFCYSDIVAYGKGFYCTEDIGKVSATTAEHLRNPINTFAYVSAVLLVANAALLLYFNPQSLTVINEIMRSGPLEFIKTINYVSLVYLSNLFIILFGFISAILLFANSGKGVAIGGLVDSFTIIITTYELLNTNANYLFAVSAVAFISIATIALSRMSSANKKYQEELKYPNVEWPKVEGF